MGQPLSPLSVGVLAYDGCLGTEIFGIADLLLIANRVTTAGEGHGDDSFHVTVVARRAAEVITAGGLKLRATRWHKSLDILVVPGFELRSSRHVGGSA